MEEKDFENILELMVQGELKPVETLFIKLPDNFEHYLDCGEGETEETGGLGPVRGEALQPNVQPVDRGDETGEAAEIRTDDEGCRLPQEVGIFYCVLNILKRLLFRILLRKYFFMWVKYNLMKDSIEKTAKNIEFLRSKVNLILPDYVPGREN